MPARLEEQHHAKEEGIEFMTLTNPTEIIGGEDGRVCGMKCIKMELGEPDASGRRRPIPVGRAANLSWTSTWSSCPSARPRTR